MDTQLDRYLDDHLGGSAGALHLIQQIADAFDDAEAKAFFTDLKQKIEADREALQCLQEAIRKESSSVLQAAGAVAARVGALKFRWEGFEPGNLGLFEALEVLALGVTGKRLLWKVLAEIAPAFPDRESLINGLLVDAGGHVFSVDRHEPDGGDIDRQQLHRCFGSDAVSAPVSTEKQEPNQAPHSFSQELAHDRTSPFES